MAPRPTGQRFYKMTGSGNDFVVFDASDGRRGATSRTWTLSRSLSARGTGHRGGRRRLPREGGGGRRPDALL